MDGDEIQIELKYCERCGGLWLRRKEQMECIARVAECVWQQCQTQGRRRRARRAAAKCVCRKAEVRRHESSELGPD